MEIVSVTGEVALLWREHHPYRGDVVLLTIEPDDPSFPATFEIDGPLAGRLDDGTLQEGMRVRVDCRGETVEVVNVDLGTTSDGVRAVVVDVAVLSE